MIVNNTYFKGEIFIPHAKPSITDSTTGVADEILDFIGEYEQECLINCLGTSLFNDFIINIDVNEPTLIDINSDEKWDRLMNGHDYNCPDTGDEKIWRGIRWKSISTGDYNRSFLAYYIYFFYERKQYISNTTTGHQIEEAENAETVTPTMKVVGAWRKFVSLVQGIEQHREVVVNNGFIGVDYYKGDQFVSLYTFIEDMNKKQEGYYANFNPKKWVNINQFGI